VTVEVITAHKGHDWRGISSAYYGVRWVCESCRQVYHGHPGQWTAACTGTRNTHAERHATVRVLGGRS